MRSTALLQHFNDDFLFSMTSTTDLSLGNVDPFKTCMNSLKKKVDKDVMLSCNKSDSRAILSHHFLAFVYQLWYIAPTRIPMKYSLVISDRLRIFEVFVQKETTLQLSCTQKKQLPVMRRAPCVLVVWVATLNPASVAGRYQKSPVVWWFLRCRHFILLIDLPRTEAVPRWDCAEFSRKYFEIPACRLVWRFIVCSQAPSSLFKKPKSKLTVWIL